MTVLSEPGARPPHGSGEVARRAGGAVASLTFHAMGTSCQLFAADFELLHSGEHWVRRMAARLTRFDPGSELSRLNSSAGRWCDISPELESVLREAGRAYELSGGLVNVAVLPSMIAIGYSRPFAAGAGRVQLGDARELPRLEDALEIAPGRARVTSGAGIDLGGIAKGWMADRLADRLGEVCLVNLGGDLAARGAGWPVGVGGRTLVLRDLGAATSSVRRRRWGSLHHLIDPRTGLPAESGLQEVSVVTKSASEAEVVAKSALLLGPEIAPTYCAAHALAWRLDP